MTTFKFLISRAVKRAALLIETTLNTTTVAIYLRILLDLIRVEIKEQVRLLFNALPNYPCSYNFRYKIKFDKTFGLSRHSGGEECSNEKEARKTTRQAERDVRRRKTKKCFLVQVPW